MKIVKYISALIMVTVFFSNCKKNREPEPVTISGTVTDHVQGIPVANATVTIKVQQASNNSVFNTGFVFVASATTDANGNYAVTFSPDDPITYRISVERDLYYSAEKDVSADVASAGTNTDLDFAINPKGWFRINIRNAFPNDIDDNIIYQNTSESSGCSSCCNNLPVSLDGMTIDTSFVCQRIANPTISYSWFVTKNGNMIPFTGSVNSIVGDTVTVNLNY